MTTYGITNKTLNDLSYIIMNPNIRVPPLRDKNDRFLLELTKIRSQLAKK